MSVNKSYFEEVSDFPSPQEVPQEMHLSQMEEHRLRASTIEKETYLIQLIENEAFNNFSCGNFSIPKNEKKDFTKTG